MRTIYLRLKDPSNFKFEIISETPHQMALYGREVGPRLSIRNQNGRNRIVMENPKLRRRIVKGITIVEMWGNGSKWFCDTDAAEKPLWGTR